MQDVLSGLLVYEQSEDDVQLTVRHSPVGGHEVVQLTGVERRFE